MRAQFSWLTGDRPKVKSSLVFVTPGNAKCGQSQEVHARADNLLSKGEVIACYLKTPCRTIEDETRFQKCVAYMPIRPTW